MKKVLLPGLVAGIVTLILGMAVSYLFMLFPVITADYNNVNIMRPWKDPLMSLFFLYPFVLCIILAWIWDKSKTLLNGAWASRALKFGFAIWMISVIPGMLMSYACFQLSLLTIISWTVEGLAQAVAAGMVFAKMNK